MSGTFIDTRTGWRLWCMAGLLAFAAGPVSAADASADRLTVRLGDYRFEPSRLTLNAGQPVVLELVNTDSVTPHNFTLKDAAGGLDIDVDVAAGERHEITLNPQASGTYEFYCNKKIPFLKSHRERGMQGSLQVVPRSAD